MGHANLNAPPQKKAKGITINKGGLRSAIEPEFSKPEDEQPLIHRHNRLRDRPQSTPIRVTAAATPSTTEPVPNPAPASVAPAFPVAPPPPRLLNILKGDEGLEGKHAEVLDTLKYHEFKQFTRPRGPYIPFKFRNST
ncbi:hypothetical protein H5410_057081 [Solanum commersonii]|uniref:Uncharacterized protein n=1 Tax=Solanum commersonii TaxID=4109 RepID=A0A9J5WM00_SOLCO|nr:hypothetical protein H5410_057081 [Solanum commersonii]